MRLNPVTICFLCAAMLVYLGQQDASAQGKHKKGEKKAETVEADPYAEGESGDEASAAPEEGEEQDTDDESAGEDESGKSLGERLNEDESGGLRRSGRMEFDERLIKGQAAKSGAVYLFKRIPRHLPGLVPMRRSYRARIVEPVLGAVALKPAEYSYEVTEQEIEQRKAAEAAALEAEAVKMSEPEVTPMEEKETEAAEEEPAAKSGKKRKNGKKRKK